MNGENINNWAEANQRYLTAQLAVVREALQRHAARGAESLGSSTFESEQALSEAANVMPAPPALDHLCAAFNLSPFERDVLLLCAGMELDGAFAASCAAAQGDPHRPYPTFSLALAALPDAHWNALTPPAPLRRWRLLEIANIGESLLHGQLRIDERVLHYLAGISYLDQRLEGLVKPFTARRELPLSQLQTAERIAVLWSRRKDSHEWPIVAQRLAANHDPGRFEQPTEFEVERPNARQHLAFGHGAHTCPGAPLARAEGRITIERLLDRMDNIRISEPEHGPAGARHYDYVPTYILRGVSRLHLEFEPRALH